MAIDKDGSRSPSAANGAAESEVETEYEIEAILGAKRGMFPGGKIGYLVKWKGYGEEDNSWVNEDDAGNADELINEYWAKKKSRKTEVKGKRGRKSTGDESADDSGSPAPKKRGRKAQARAASEESQDTDARTVKKARTGAARKTSENITQDEDEDAEIIIGDMSKYESWPTWEDLIETIDTVEKDLSGNMTLYFTLKSGERIREKADMCKKRCPQKLIAFFEKHLRWREAEVEEIA